MNKERKKRLLGIDYTCKLNPRRKRGKKEQGKIGENREPRRKNGIGWNSGNEGNRDPR